MLTRRLIGTVGLFALTAGAAAQDEKKGPPLPADVVPSSFRAYLVVDDRFPPKVNPPTKPEHRDPKDRTNKMHCLVCENGLSPTVAIFVRSPIAAPDDKGARSLVVGAESPLAKLIKSVDSILPKFRGEKLCGFVMFLQLEGGTKLAKITAADGTVTNVESDKEYPDDEKRDMYAKEIRDFSNAVKAPTLPFGLAPVASKSITEWKIGDADEVTVVLFDRLRVVKRWAMKASDIGDAQIKEILTAAEKAATGKN